MGLRKRKRDTLKICLLYRDRYRFEWIPRAFSCLFYLCKRQFIRDPVFCEIGGIVKFSSFPCLKAFGQTKCAFSAYTVAVGNICMRGRNDEDARADRARSRRHLQALFSSQSVRRILDRPRQRPSACVECRRREKRG